MINPTMMNLKMNEAELSGFEVVIKVGIIGPLKIFLYSLKVELPFLISSSELSFTGCKLQSRNNF